MKLWALSFFISFCTFAAFNENSKGEYPEGPSEELTPGSLCDRPNEYRYPEKIPYCERNVDINLKNEVFKEYRQAGYRLNPKDRKYYKIDHLIPLCAGGSNHEDNLWPQHESIYNQTDPLESVGCEKLKFGKIKQDDLIRLILSAKKDLSLVQRTLFFLNSL